MGELTAGVTNDASGSLHALVERVQDEPWSLVIALGAVLLALRLLGLRRGPTCRPGELWFAMVPFEDGTGAKDRPVLVLTTTRRSCTVARLTSQDRGARHDVIRVPEGVPGLSKASWISLRTVRLRRRALRRRIGDPGEALVEWYQAARGAAGAGDGPRR